MTLPKPTEAEVARIYQLVDKMEKLLAEKQELQDFYHNQLNIYFLISYIKLCNMHKSSKKI
ncbi:MAG: hypothetical protein V1773_16880 [bacterium]